MLPITFQLSIFSHCSHCLYIYAYGRRTYHSSFTFYKSLIRDPIHDDDVSSSTIILPLHPILNDSNTPYNTLDDLYNIAQHCFVTTTTKPAKPATTKQTKEDHSTEHSIKHHNDHVDLSKYIHYTEIGTQSTYFQRMLFTYEWHPSHSTEYDNSHSFSPSVVPSPVMLFR